jgi:hypothetical protein
MESLVYHLHRSEFTATFFDELRSAVNASIGGERIKIVVEQEEERPFTALEQKIMDSANDPVRYVFEGDEFEVFAQKVMNGETVDVEQYKRVRQ